MTGPTNVILGDSSPIDLPQMEIPEDELIQERQMAKFSRTAEFKRLKSHLEERIAFYQSYLPDGRPVGSIPAKDLESMWIVANTIIGELSGVISAYELANEQVRSNNG